METEKYVWSVQMGRTCSYEIFENKTKAIEYVRGIAPKYF